VPSSVFDAAGLWTAREGDWRQLDYVGHRDGERYRLDVQPSAPPPREAGDYRGRLRLHRLEEGRYEWVMRQELAVGSMQPDDVARTLTALFRSLEGVSAQQVRLAAEEAFPRSVAAFSRLYDLEVFELSPEVGGATAVHLEIRLRPDRMRETAPRYAAFLEKVAMPMQGSATLSDATGETWWRFEFAKLHWTFRFRVRDGSLVPLDGGAERRLPDRLRLSIDFSTKAGPFTVGVRGLTAEVTLTRTPREKSYTLLYREEPEWRLPFLVKPLLRSSLSYPFEGPGSSSSFGVRASAEGPTRLAREYGFRVRESWIVKWMGGLGNSAMQDFRKGAESESDRYSRDCLYALRDDLVALLTE
jgi:hypothetical protein